MESVIDFNSRSVDYQRKARVPLISLFLGGLGIIMLSVGLVPVLLRDAAVEWVSLAMGTAFLLWSILVYRAQRTITRPKSA